jgi:ribosomal protein L7/L12
MPTHSLPPHVLAALQRGSSLEAIKLLRESTGMGLREAKEVIDQYPKVAVFGVDQARAFPAEVVQALQRGDKLQAVKLLRELSGVGLLEAKDAVEQALGEAPAEQGGMPAPGKVPSASLWKVILVLAAALGLAYLACTALSHG